jgi:hypothetical protein
MKVSVVQLIVAWVVLLTMEWAAPLIKALVALLTTALADLATEV